MDSVHKDDSTEKQPARTCLACRKKVGKGSLWRFVVRDGRLVCDGSQKMHGRGSYCCKDDGCLQLFIGNKKRLARSFRVEVFEINGNLPEAGVENG